MILYMEVGQKLPDDIKRKAFLFLSHPVADLIKDESDRTMMLYRGVESMTNDLLEFFPLIDTDHIFQHYEILEDEFVWSHHTLFKQKHNIVFRSIYKMVIVLIHQPDLTTYYYTSKAIYNDFKHEFQNMDTLELLSFFSNIFDIIA